MIHYIAKYPIIGASVFVTLLPIVILLIRRDRNETLRIFLYYLGAQCILDIIALYFSSRSNNTLLICNLWHLISFVWLSHLFKGLFESKKEKSVIIYLTISYVGIFILDIILSNPNIYDLHNHSYNTVIPTLYHFLLVGYCLYYYLEGMYDFNTFWLVTSLLFYNSVSLCASAFYNWYMKWQYDPVLLIVMYIPYLAYSLHIIFISITLLFNKKVWYNK